MTDTKRSKKTIHSGVRKCNTNWRMVLIMAMTIMCFVPSIIFAQAPARFYWKSLMGTNAVPVIFQSLGGNANPLDPAYIVSADGKFEAQLIVAGYAKMLPLFGRPAVVALLILMGRISGSGTLAGSSFSEDASGFGDPMIEFNINLVGSKPIVNIPDLLRYQPGFSLDLIIDLAFPIGEYNSSNAINLGQNRWYGRIAAPIIVQIGPWIPGQRTTFEMVSSLWLFSNNNDFHGQTLETDPMFQIEGHLTSDITETFWASLDGVWITGGKSSINGESGSSINNIGVGFTLGYQLNDNIQLTSGYMATINDSDPQDLRMDGFRISLVYGWHKLIEGMKRLND